MSGPVVRRGSGPPPSQETIDALPRRLGHSRGEQSMQYARHEIEETTDMEKAAQLMGLQIPDRLKDELPDRNVED